MGKCREAPRAVRQGGQHGQASLPALARAPGRFFGLAHRGAEPGSKRQGASSASPGRFLARPAWAGSRTVQSGMSWPVAWRRGAGVLEDWALRPMSPGNPRPPKGRPGPGPGGGRSRRGSGPMMPSRGAGDDRGVSSPGMPPPSPPWAGALAAAAACWCPPRASCLHGNGGRPGTGATDRPGVPVWGLSPPGLGHPRRSVPPFP
ncbi:MAG: hypothetical protein LBP92_06645 [Deltaproteobacteria bacterium]|nr:hypothetical protein [Deltaproteobacteria bacterium]